MAFTPINVDTANLTIMGIEFPDRATLDAAANGLGSAVFEGFTPTAAMVRLLRSYLPGEVALTQLPGLVQDLA
ncbi:MAG: hypothetical protein LBG60_04640 [Bifidobacteriaceae bacterium]|nr:hypothetical protein [Bifidobacteriaceae bacterium]